jgi:predicted transcriptional regulator
VYIIKDIILKLVEYGELNQTALITFCALNLSKHRQILEELESKGLIKRETSTLGKRKISIFKVTPRGIEFCRDILTPYENMFPRNDK